MFRLPLVHYGVPLSDNSLKCISFLLIFQINQNLKILIRRTVNKSIRFSAGIIFSVATSSFAAIHGRDFRSSQEAPASTTRTAHCVTMSRFMQIRFLEYKIDEKRYIIGI